MNECLDIIDGLKDLISSDSYRKSLGLPNEVVETYENLAHGEYNQNFIFIHPITNEKLVLRVERGSQMGIDNQIEYEFNALKFLEKSGRTPTPLYCDGSRLICKNGVLVEKFLRGQRLDYENSFHLKQAAAIFADIHSLETAGVEIIKAKDAKRAMLDECLKMAGVYFASNVCMSDVKNQIDRLLLEAQNAIATSDNSPTRLSIINTEVNNTNFLINEHEKSYLIDWEKPLLSDPAQDIGHFLADTTTFWKTEFFFTQSQKEDFVDEYIDSLKGRLQDECLKKRCLDFANFTCLRGVCWCAMASVEYESSSKEILDPTTRKKLPFYLDVEYLKSINLKC